MLTVKLYLLIKDDILYLESFWFDFGMPIFIQYCKKNTAISILILLLTKVSKSSLKKIYSFLTVCIIQVRLIFLSVYNLQVILSYT